MITHPIAKVNLGLNVVEHRSDGYHNLETVFYPVPISDTLEVNIVTANDTQEYDCQLTLKGMSIEGDSQKNLIVKAYELLKADYPHMPRVRAILDKCIPTQAGMGGGSSDGAYMLCMLNQLCELGLNKSQLIGYATRLGADCAFFIDPLPQYAEGIGERLQPITLQLKGWHFAVVRPDIPVSTREAFALVTPQKPERCCYDIVKQPVETWREQLVNDFEASVFAQHPEIGHVKQQLYDMGAVYAAMSGSGSALFALFRQQPPVQQSFPNMFTYTTLL